MENFWRRFPLASKKIFKNLDNQTLVISKEASKTIDEVLRNEKYYFIRIIKDHQRQFEGCEGSWKEVIKNCPIEMLRQLTVAMLEFFKSNNWREQVTPLHIAAKNGHLEIVKYIIGKRNLSFKISPLMVLT